jgi:hypothetical protein
MEASYAGKREYGGKGRWVKYWACLGCWISPRYGPSSLGARFETYKPFISLIFNFFFSPRWTADNWKCGYCISGYGGHDCTSQHQMQPIHSTEPETQGQLNFLRRYLIFVHPQYTDCFIPPNWQLEFWEGFQIFQNTVQPCTEHSTICLTCHKLTNSAGTELWLVTRYWHTAAEFQHNKPECSLGLWQNTLKATNSTVIRSETDCKCKSPLCSVTEILNLCHKGTNITDRDGRSSWERRGIVAFRTCRWNE